MKGLGPKGYFSVQGFRGKSYSKYLSYIHHLGPFIQADMLVSSNIVLVDPGSKVSRFEEIVLTCFPVFMPLNFSFELLLILRHEHISAQNMELVQM